MQITCDDAYEVFVNDRLVGVMLAEFVALLGAHGALDGAAGFAKERRDLRPQRLSGARGTRHALRAEATQTVEARGSFGRVGGERKRFPARRRGPDHVDSQAHEG